MTIRNDLPEQLEIEAIRKHLEKLTTESRNLNDFVGQALQLVGDYIGAWSLIVSIHDCEQDYEVICARLSNKQHNSWQFELGDAGTFNLRPVAQQIQAQDFSHHPFHSFRLALPPRWRGIFQVEYPVTNRYASERHRTLKNLVTDLSYGLHISLLTQQQRQMEDNLPKETGRKLKSKDGSKIQGLKVKPLNHQVKQKYHNVPEIDQREGSILKQAPRSVFSSYENQSLFTKLVLNEIEQSRKTAFVGELAAGVAHQIRNPLNNLLGAMHLIKDDETPEEERRKLFGQLTERIETINRMISEFIYYTQITELNRTSEDINTVLKNSLCSFKRLTDQSNVKLITSFALQLPAISLDLYLMNQVFHNIIKNALEAMNNVGQLRVSVQRLKTKHGPKPSLEFVEITFQDTGPGIPKEDLQKVLNPFYSKKSDGIGLGLSIVKHVVRVHGGATQIKSQLGLFTKVKIYLPIR